VTRGLVAVIADCADLCAAAQAFNDFFLPRRALDPVANRLTRAIRDCEQEDLLTPSGILRRFGGPALHARGCVKKSGGVSLRRFARLARFDRALISVDTERHLRMADIAQSVGYYDEAHMVHDFIAFCGVSPAAYRRARLAQECCQLPPHLFACA
jgi:AraC-like DNA-binding protein